MKIIDEEHKKELPKLKPGDVIRAELHKITYYFMIVIAKDFNFNYYSMVQLNHHEAGKLTFNGDLFQSINGDYCLSIDDIIKNLKKSGFKHIEKVELEARVKHEQD